MVSAKALYPTDSFTPLGLELRVRFRLRVRVTMRVRAGVRAREIGLGERIRKELKLKFG